MYLSNIEIIVGVGFTVLLVSSWYGLVLALRPVSRIRESLKAAHEQIAASREAIDNLLNAWARSIAICDSCNKLLFTTSKAKSVRHIGSKVTLFYCQDCKDEG